MSVSLLMDLLSYCKIPPSVNQVELHPRNSQKSLVAFCHSKGTDNVIFLTDLSLSLKYYVLTNTLFRNLKYI